MVGVAPDLEGGRRLPQWMLGASAGDQVGKYDDTKVKKKQLQERLPSQASHSDPRTKKTRRVKVSSLVEGEDLSDNSHVLSKCQMKRRKPKETQEDANPDMNIYENVPEKKYKRTRRELSRPASGKKLKTKDFEKELEIQRLREDEDVELTVEDLMTIAKEYVRDDKSVEQGQASKSKCERRYTSTTTVSSGNESTDNIGARICNEIGTSHDISASHNQTKDMHDMSTSALFRSKSHSTEESVINTSSTGDPAHDMLHLFLGPLLKKPVNEKKSDSLSKDVAFFQEFGTQHKINTVREAIAPVTKKKSSLKDKIAMFLD